MAVVGADVEEVNVGERVFGMNGFDGLAEQVIMPRSDWTSHTGAGPVYGHAGEEVDGRDVRRIPSDYRN